MPTYSYQCGNGHAWERTKPMSEHATDPCPECGEEGNQTITPFNKIVFQPYFDEVTDTYYRDARQKREDLKRLGLEHRR